VFPDLFLPNLLVFVAGVTTAVACLRTGMLQRGILLLVLLLASADAALLLRFAAAERGEAYWLVLTAMQALAVGASVWLLAARARRRWSADARQRRQLFAAALVHYLRHELEPAAALLTRLRRADPWDVPTCLLLGNVLAAGGQLRRARRCYRAAKNLDREAGYVDLVALQLARLEQGAAPPAPAPAPGAAANVAD
jgi:tetratricopeptide (TPR) repeat protein